MNVRRMVAITAMSALAVGCGSSAETTKASSTSVTAPITTLAGTSPTTTAASASSTAVAATTSVPDSSESTTTEPNFSGAGSENFCKFLKKLDDSKALDSAFDDSATPETLKTGFETAKSAIADMAKLAPGEIKGDVTTLSAGFTQLSDVFAKYGYDSTKLAAAAASDPTLLDTITKLTEDAKYNDASDRLNAYGEKVCGLPPA